MIEETIRRACTSENSCSSLARYNSSNTTDRKKRDTVGCALEQQRSAMPRREGWWTELTEFYRILFRVGNFRSQKEILYNSVNSVENIAFHVFHVLLSSHIKQDRPLTGGRRVRGEVSILSLPSLRPLRPPVKTNSRLEVQNPVIPSKSSYPWIESFNSQLTSASSRGFMGH